MDERHITDRGRIDEALRDSSAQFQRLYESDLIGIAVADAAGAFLDANDHFLRMVGYTRKELHGGRVNWLAITPAEYLPQDEAGIAEAALRGSCTPYEKEYIRKDGTRLPT